LRIGVSFGNCSFMSKRGYLFFVIVSYVLEFHHESSDLLIGCYNCPRTENFPL